jgi:tetratricopeptide (TPR) repeat protein
VKRPGAREPLRVELALRLLPEIDVLAPLRAFLVSSSRRRRPDPAASAPYETVGKRVLEPADVRKRVQTALAQVGRRASRLYGAAVDALEAEQRGDMSGAVRALLRAAEWEEKEGRLAQVRPWVAHALRIAEELRDRRPEIAALRQIGRLEAARGHLEEAARAIQRSLALAEAEMDPMAVSLACEGLGNLALARREWKGAESWFRRGLRNEVGDDGLVARLTLGLSEVERGRSDVPASGEFLRRARGMFEAARDEEGVARAVHAEGLLSAARGDPGAALAKYHEALGRLDRAGGNVPLELAVRLSLCELHLESRRLPDADDEARRGEDVAIRHNLVHDLARFYVVMGKVRGRQSDENGFVFFENALECCRGPEPAPQLEAEVLLEYARFRVDLADPDEARECLDRARGILDLLGDERGIRSVDAARGLLAAR